MKFIAVIFLAEDVEWAMSPCFFGGRIRRTKKGEVQIQKRTRRIGGV